MIFILKTDFYQIIKQDVLDNLTEADDTLLDNEEAYAMAKAEAYLGARFDLATEYGNTGTDRNEMLIRAIIGLMLYNLYARRSTQDLPEHIIDRKIDAEMWLEGVRDGKLSSQMVLTDSDTGRQNMFLGSCVKYSRKF